MLKREQTDLNYWITQTTEIFGIALISPTKGEKHWETCCKGMGSNFYGPQKQICWMNILSNSAIEEWSGVKNRKDVYQCKNKDNSLTESDRHESIVKDEI